MRSSRAIEGERGGVAPRRKLEIEARQTNEFDHGGRKLELMLPSRMYWYTCMRYTKITQQGGSDGPASGKEPRLRNVVEEVGEGLGCHEIPAAVSLPRPENDS